MWAPLDGALAFSGVAWSSGGARLVQVGDETLCLACAVAFMVIFGPAARAAFTLEAAAASNVIGQAHGPPTVVVGGRTMRRNVCSDIEVGAGLDQRV